MPSETLLDRCREGVKIAQRYDADDVEVYGQTAESVNSVVEKHDLQIAKSQFETSFGVRALVDGRLGFASTNDVSNWLLAIWRSCFSTTELTLSAVCP